MKLYAGSYIRCVIGRMLSLRRNINDLNDYLDDFEWQSPYIWLQNNDKSKAFLGRGATDGAKKVAELLVGMAGDAASPLRAPHDRGMTSLSCVSFVYMESKRHLSFQMRQTRLTRPEHDARFAAEHCQHMSGEYMQE